MKEIGKLAYFNYAQWPIKLSYICLFGISKDVSL